MAIRKSPYKVNEEGIDEAFVLPEGKQQPPTIKVRRARREDEEEYPEDPFGGVDPLDLSKQIVSFRTLHDGDELPEDRDAPPEPNKESGRREVTFELPARKTRESKGSGGAGRKGKARDGERKSATKKAKAQTKDSRSARKNGRDARDARDGRDGGRTSGRGTRGKTARDSGTRREDRGQGRSARTDEAGAQTRTGRTAKTARNGRAQTERTDRADKPARNGRTGARAAEAARQPAAPVPAPQSPRALAGLVFPTPGHTTKKNVFPTPGSRRAQPDGQPDGSDPHPADQINGQVDGQVTDQALAQAGEQSPALTGAQLPAPDAATAGQELLAAAAGRQPSLLSLLDEQPQAEPEPATEPAAESMQEVQELEPAPEETAQTQTGTDDQIADAPQDTAPDADGQDAVQDEADDALDKAGEETPDEPSAEAADAADTADAPDASDAFGEPDAAGTDEAPGAGASSDAPEEAETAEADDAAEEADTTGGPSGDPADEADGEPSGEVPADVHPGAWLEALADEEPAAQPEDDAWTEGAGEPASGAGVETDAAGAVPVVSAGDAHVLDEILEEAGLLLNEAGEAVLPGQAAPANSTDSDVQTAADGDAAADSSTEDEMPAEAEQTETVATSGDGAADSADAAETASEFAVDEAADDDDEVIPEQVGIGAVGENPWGEGAGTSPEGRVHFMHFYTWNTIPGSIVSLRTEQGDFLAPGFVTAIQDTRAAGPILTSVREAAMKRGWELCIQKLFVPVVYPVKAVFRHWKQAANPFEQNIVYLHYLLQSNDTAQLSEHFNLGVEAEIRPMSTYYSALLNSTNALRLFFEDERHACCHGLVLREAASLFFGRKFPNGGRLINYAILRPEWIVDVRPVAGAPDLMGRARWDPRTSLCRIRKLLVTNDEELEKARITEERRLKREGIAPETREGRSVYNDGLDCILNGLMSKR